MHFDEEMGFQYLGPGITVLSPSDPRPPTVRFDSIVVLAGGRRRCIGLGGVGFAPSNEDLAFRAGVCHLMNLFLRTMFKLRQGPVQFLATTFFWPLSRRILFEMTQILEPFWFFFGPGTLPGRCPARPSVSATKEFDAYYSVVTLQLYKPAMGTEYYQQSPRECRYCIG